jgi:UDP-glucuronate decarboxylase
MDSYFDFRSDIDVIYNFACPASPPRYQSMPIETMMTCVIGTKNVLDLALEHNAVVVHASTSEVYGDPDVSPQPEKYRGLVNSFGPRACYDEGKRAAEALCYDYIHKFNLDVRIVRIFNTYGPNMDPDDGRVISNFINQALRGGPLTIYGDGSQTRSFCYVDDLVDGIVKLAAINNDQRLWSRPINLGNPDEFTIAELARMVTERYPDVKIVHRDLPADDPLQRKPDITTAKNVLVWEPRVQLSYGLDRTIEYFKKIAKR